MTDPATDHSAASSDPDTPDVPDEFARQAQAPSRNVLVELGIEFLQFLEEEKKWWLIPIIVSLGLIATLALLLHSPAAPFIYPLF